MIHRFLALFIIAILIYSTVGQVMGQLCYNSKKSDCLDLQSTSSLISDAPCDEEGELPLQEPIPSISFIDILETEATLLNYDLVLYKMFIIGTTKMFSSPSSLEQGNLKSFFPPPEEV